MPGHDGRGSTCQLPPLTLHFSFATARRLHYFYT